MVRLYKCPPGLSGAYPADYITKPLVRWSRHRELLEVVARSRPFSPRLFQLKETFLNVAIWVGIFSCFLSTGIQITFDYSRLNWPNYLVLDDPWLIFLLRIPAGIAFIFIVSILWLIVPNISQEYSFRLKGYFFKLFGKERSWKGWIDFYIAGIDYRGSAAVWSSITAFLTQGQVWRMRWGWPMFCGAFAITYHPALQTIFALEDYFFISFLAETILVSITLFLSVHYFFLPLRVSGGIFSGFFQFLWEIECRKFLELISMIYLQWLPFIFFLGFGRDLIEKGIRFLASQGDEWHWVIWTKRPLLWAGFCLALVIFRRRLEVLLMAGSPRLARETLRLGEKAFRERVQKIAEAPPRPDPL